MDKQQIDTADLLEKRELLRDLLTESNIDVIGSGYGMGSADISIVIDNKRYDIEIHPPVYLSEYGISDETKKPSLDQTKEPLNA